MRLIGLAVVFAVGLAFSPLVVDAQQTEKVRRISVSVLQRRIGKWRTVNAAFHRAAWLTLMASGLLASGIRSPIERSKEDTMKRNLFAAATLVCVLSAGHWVWAQQTAVGQVDTVKWGPASPALPAGAQQSVLAGDPSKEGAYVVRVKFPAGYKVAPHTHPNDENVTVISGMFHVGIGDKFDESKGQAFKPGGYIQVPKGVQHFAWASEETVIQLHGVGPGGLAYVNAADDPRKK